MYTGIFDVPEFKDHTLLIDSKNSEIKAENDKYFPKKLLSEVLLNYFQ